MAIHYRQELRKKLTALWDKLDLDTQKKVKREWAQILEQVLYKKRKDDK